MSFSQKLQSGQFVVTVECNPPKGADLAPMFAEIEKYKNYVDAVNVTDCAMAKIRISSIIACYLIQEKFKLETIFNFTCRDRNLIALQAELLGAYAVNVKNILAIAGDPPSHGDCPEAKAVFDVDSVGLITLAKNLNLGEHLKNEFLIGTTVCLDPQDPGKEKEKLKKKLKAGADFIITQPFYTEEVFAKAKKWLPKTKTPLIVGIMPLKSVKMAQYLNKNVPGITVPEEIIKTLNSFSSATQISEYNLQIIKKLLNNIKGAVSGIHIMPMGGGDLIKKIVAIL